MTEPKVVEVESQNQRAIGYSATPDLVEGDSTRGQAFRTMNLRFVIL